MVSLCIKLYFIHKLSKKYKNLSFYIFSVRIFVKKIDYFYYLSCLLNILIIFNELDI